MITMPTKIRLNPATMARYREVLGANAIGRWTVDMWRAALWAGPGPRPDYTDDEVADLVSELNAQLDEGGYSFNCIPVVEEPNQIARAVFEGVTSSAALEVRDDFLRLIA